jgi:hypothetical protein
VIAVALLLAAIPATASAKFTRTTSATSLSVKSDTLSAPTNLRVSCYGSGGRIKLTWTITADTYASGYIGYGNYLGYEVSENIPGGRTTSSYTPPDSAPAGTVVTLVSYFSNWTSARSSSVTAPNCP